MVSPRLQRLQQTAALFAVISEIDTPIRATKLRGWMDYFSGCCQQEPALPLLAEIEPEMRYETEPKKYKGYTYEELESFLMSPKRREELKRSRNQNSSRLLEVKLKGLGLPPNTGKRWLPSSKKDYPLEGDIDQYLAGEDGEYNCNTDTLTKLVPDQDQYYRHICVGNYNENLQGPEPTHPCHRCSGWYCEICKPYRGDRKQCGSYRTEPCIRVREILQRIHGGQYTGAHLLELKLNKLGLPQRTRQSWLSDEDDSTDEDDSRDDTRSSIHSLRSIDSLVWCGMEWDGVEEKTEG